MSIRARAKHDGVFAHQVVGQHEALERKQLAQVALSALNDRERKVVIGHLVEGFTHKELCQSLNVTQSRCHQIELRAIAKMRVAVERKPLPKVEGLKPKDRKKSISCKPTEMSASERDARKRASSLATQRFLMSEWLKGHAEWERRLQKEPDDGFKFKGWHREITEATRRLLIKVCEE